MKDTKTIQIKTIERKNHCVTIRVTASVSKWLRQKNYSPTAIFYQALIDLKCPGLLK